MLAERLTPLQELDKFMGGALQERVARAISEVTGNIYDLNTKADATRKVTITLTIKPTKSRREAAISTQVVAKLAPLQDLETVAQIGVDDVSGELIMVEQTEIANGQINIDGEIHEDNIARFPAAAK